MTPDERKAFVSNYLEYLRWNRLPADLPTNEEEAEAFVEKVTRRSKHNPYKEEIGDLWDAIHEDPEFAWQLLLTIIARAEEPELGMLGAGDLETFVHVRAVGFADRIDAEIRSNPKFRKAFESVHIGNSTPPEVGRRFNTALRESGVAEEHIVDWWS
jgi:uncharacterized protein DUF6869